MTEKKTTTTAQKQPDGIITTQRNGQTIVAELFFNHRSAETFRDKLLKAISSTIRIFLRLTVKSRKTEYLTIGTLWTRNVSPEHFLLKKRRFSQVKSRRKHPKMPLLRNRGAERRVYENRTEKAGKDHRYLV